MVSVLPLYQHVSLLFWWSSHYFNVIFLWLCLTVVSMYDIFCYFVVSCCCFIKMHFTLINSIFIFDSVVVAKYSFDPIVCTFFSLNYSICFMKNVLKHEANITPEILLYPIIHIAGNYIHYSEDRCVTADLSFIFNHHPYLPNLHRKKGLGTIVHSACIMAAKAKIRWQTCCSEHDFALV